ncbi:MAG: hypothetical protein K4571_08140 [Deltaproteobacteria bacterium]
MIFNNLNSLRKEFAKLGTLTPPIWHSALAIIRIEIHKNNEQDEFKYLNMFCNLCLHDKLERTNTATEFIVAFLTALGCCDSLGSSEIDKASDTIFDSFKKDVATFFQKNRINDELIVDDNKFFAVLGFTLYYSVGKKAAITDKNKVKEIHSLMKKIKIFDNSNYDPFPSLEIIKKDDGKLLWKLAAIESTDILFPLKYKNKRPLMPF